MTFSTLIRQWERSTLSGFIRRMGGYLLGYPCAMCKGNVVCKDRVITNQGISERWQCEGCLYGWREIF
jgi:hypothetical protein